MHKASVEFLRKSKADTIARRAAAKAAIEAATSEARAAKRDLTGDEQTRYDLARRDFDRLDDELREIDERLDDAVEDALREARIAESRAATGGGETRTERPGDTPWYTSSEVYQRGDQKTSWLRDQITVALNRPGAGDALERLHRNQRAVADVEKRAGLTTTDGAGGDFAPPAYLIQDYVAFARAKRVTANLVHRESLPGGVDSINIPTVATGTATAVQATQNTAIQQTDATTGTVTAALQTVAGGQTLSVQSVEMSPVNFDNVILGDLLADLAKQVNSLVINGNVTNAKGILNVAGTNAVTLATATVAAAYPKVADAIQRITTARFDNADCIVMHPRRWAWFLAAVDSSSRPLVVPNVGGVGPNNALGSGAPNAQGLAGYLLGLPVYLDATIPINLGAGTNEDRILVFRQDDIWLWENTPRAEVFRETKSDSLALFLRVYEYYGIAHRAPAGESIVAGAGLATPSF